MKKMLTAVLGISLLVLGGTNHSRAELVTWQLTGEVFQVGTPLQHIFSIGNNVTYTFTIDTETPDVSPTNIYRGDYKGAIISSTVIVDNYSATIENYELTVVNDFSDSPFDLFGFANPMPTTIVNGSSLQGSDGLTYKFNGVYGHFKDSNATMLSSISLDISVERLNNHNTFERFDVAWVSGGLMNGVAVTNIHVTDITCGLNDTDADGHFDLCDNCPDTYNSTQIDSDGDSFGDLCDVCPDLADDQTDTDNDGIGDVCDNSPNVPIKSGDINNVGNINLIDAILTLQVMSNISPSVPVFREADINNDKKIGAEEAIYVLQVISGLRPETFFTGIYNFSEEYDLNISNGVDLNLGSVVFEMTPDGPNSLNLQGVVTNPDEGTFSFQLPLVVSGSTATLPSHPYPIPGGSGNLLEVLMLSDGNNMVYTSVGQEAENLADISLSVANWVRTPTQVIIDDFVGNWSGVFYTDPNLSDTTNGFSVSNQSGSISKVNADTISIIIDGEPLLFDVVNNRATLAGAPATTAAAIYHAISLVTDGVGLSWYMVATELSDPTDVSVDIGLMTKQ